MHLDIFFFNNPSKLTVKLKMYKKNSIVLKANKTYTVEFLWFWKVHNFFDANHSALKIILFERVWGENPCLGSYKYDKLCLSNCPGKELRELGGKGSIMLPVRAEWERQGCYLSLVRVLPLFCMIVGVKHPLWPRELVRVPGAGPLQLPWESPCLLWDPRWCIAECV